MHKRALFYSHTCKCSLTLKSHLIEFWSIAWDLSLMAGWRTVTSVPVKIIWERETTHLQKNNSKTYTHSEKFSALKPPIHRQRKTNWCSTPPRSLIFLSTLLKGLCFVMGAAPCWLTWCLLMALSFFSLMITLPRRLSFRGGPSGAFITNL